MHQLPFKGLQTLNIGPLPVAISVQLASSEILDSTPGNILQNASSVDEDVDLVYECKTLG